MWTDPVVEEVRRIRLEIETECHNDFDELLAQAVQASKMLHNQREAISLTNPISNEKNHTNGVGKLIDEAILRRIIREELHAIG